MRSLVPCNESEATHVQILPDEYGHIDMMNVTEYAIYRILYNDEPSFEGEEMIKCDDGAYASSFSLVVNVRWMKEAFE
jgi:hypothetical protein